MLKSGDGRAFGLSYMVTDSTPPLGCGTGITYTVTTGGIATNDDMPPIGVTGCRCSDGAEPTTCCGDGSEQQVWNQTRLPVALSGSFQIEINGELSAHLDYEADAAAVQTAIGNMACCSVPDLVEVVLQVSKNSLRARTWEIVFAESTPMDVQNLQDARPADPRDDVDYHNRGGARRRK